MNSKPDIHPVREGEEHTGEIARPRFPPIFWALTFNVALLCVLLPLMVIGVVQLHRYESRLGSIEAAVTGGLAETRDELVALRQVVGSQTAEDVIFLKILILNRKVKPNLAREIAKSVHTNAQLFKRDPDFILAMIFVESNFNPSAVSVMKATGLMQVMPHWTDQLGITENLTDVNTSIRYGLQIFAFYDQMYKDTETALMAYNRGPGRVDSDLMSGRDPTRNGYAKKIMKTYDRLKTMNIEVTDSTTLH